MTLSELARASNLPKSTVHRLLARLVELDAVEQTDEGYRVSVSLAQLASFTPANLMRDIALPHMARLHQWTGQTITLGVLRDFDVVVLEQVGTLAWHEQPNHIGVRLPANCAAMGKALLAWDPREALRSLLPRPLPAMTSASVTDPDELLRQLREVRATNVARTLDESRIGTASIASAVIIKGVAVGALAIVHPAAAPISPQAATALRQTTARLAKDIQDSLHASGQQKRWMPGRRVEDPLDPASTDDHEVT